MSVTSYANYTAKREPAQLLPSVGQRPRKYVLSSLPWAAPRKTENVSFAVPWPAFSYFPFGGGGRRCLGESFAELEGLLIVATMASKVRLRLVDGQTIVTDPLFTLRPNIPMHMTIESVDTLERHPTIV